MAVPRIFVLVVVLLVSCVARANAEFALLEHSTSPDGKFAFATEDAPGNEGTRLWLVHMPAVATIGLPAPDLDFLGNPIWGKSIWNTKARRVALTQSGRHWARTRVFGYSQKVLQEFPLPDLAKLPDRWFTGYVRFTSQYVCAVRWLGKNRLEFSVSGTVIYHDGKADADFHEYDLQAVVEIDADGGRISRVRENE